MSEAFPRHVLCVLGSGLGLAEMERIATEFGGFVLDHEYSEAEHDPRMPEAFEASFQASRAAASFSEADRAAVESHDTVGYLLSMPMMRELAADTSRRLLAATAALLRGGAVAVKNESSGITHGRVRWLTLARQAAGAKDEELADALVSAWVRRPIYGGRVLYSCGMHLLGAPEVEIEVDRELTEDGVSDLVTHLDALALYLLTDPRAAEIEDGAGFRLTEDAPRRVLRTGACDRYDEDDLFFNPYGYVRLTPSE
ncbi:hypothetical protein SAMN05444920_107474 [Nonomuraea solani]|uniref:DUF4261 domain-containing protein n=1 Tax=Nonomuraea solani TaxID=1144553 RepID=A0A1H6E4R3_9ACTN|nr:hypothetical protein [Nonomuraea solani]SEG92213.1 hypothetical protein SAMN05444920_107474 [Nonomuraea solani]